MKTIFVLLIFVGLLFAIKVNIKTEKKEFKTKEDVNLIFSEINKVNLEVYKNRKRGKLFF